MLRSAYIILFLLGLTLLAPAQAQTLEKHEVSPNASISVPKEFRKLTGPEITKHYLSYRQQPLAMFVDASGEVELVVNESKAMFEANDVAMMKDFYKANVRALYTKVNFWKEAIETVGGRKAVVLEFSSETAEKNKPTIKKYTYAQYLVRPRKVRGETMGGYVEVFTFTCDEKNRSKWQAIARKVMETARVRG